MCGILLYYSSSKSVKDDNQEFPKPQEKEVSKLISDTTNEFQTIVPYILNRGPDYASFRTFLNGRLKLFSSVLSLRQPFTKQCVYLLDRYAIQFNGEIYAKECQGCDTTYFTDLITKAIEKDNVPELLRSLEGEFAYTVCDLLNRKVYFGRDSLGKRSLTYRLVDNELYVSSLAGDLEYFQDCQGRVLYIFDMESGTLQTKELDDEYKVSPVEDLYYRMENDYLEALYDTLFDSVRDRILSIEPLHMKNTPISILFSGGLDCCIIAGIICEILKNCDHRPSLELLNVAFENPRTKSMPENTPDRKLAIQSAETLQHLYSTIDLKLVQVDVSYNEYLEERRYIAQLMAPKQTEMDLSISAAFYFAARGDGFVKNKNNEPIRYKRKALVLFSGLGADELFGGYHKFANKSITDLIIELEHQINNIPERNLIRDDKVIATHGVEVRYPFLDKRVIQYSTGHIPINYKIDKRILRTLASKKLHLDSISTEPKRAIQFGAKSAKMHKNSQKRGTDIIAF